MLSSLGSRGGMEIIDTTPGLSQEHAVEDCYTLKSLLNKATSGFYWVQPLCSAKALRAYCDISSGWTYVTLPDTDGIVSVGDATAACAGEQPPQSVNSTTS